MLQKCLLIILFTLLLLPTSILGQDYNVKVTLKDGSIVEGKLLKISAEGVDINPGGNVKYRFISSDRIQNVNIVELNKIVEFPLIDGSIPQEVVEYKMDESPTPTYGFPKFLGIGTIGYASVGDWGYYEGLNSGMAFRLGLYYFFHETDVTASRFLVGFTYYNASIGGDKIYEYEPKLGLSEYSFEFGRTTGLLGKGSYFYYLMGLVVVTNDLEINLGTTSGVSSSLHTNETKFAIRFEVDGSIYLGSRLSLLISLGYDVVMGEKQKSSSYSYNEPVFSVGRGDFQYFWRIIIWLLMINYFIYII